MHIPWLPVHRQPVVSGRRFLDIAAWHACGITATSSTPSRSKVFRSCFRTSINTLPTMDTALQLRALDALLRTARCPSDIISTSNRLMIITSITVIDVLVHGSHMIRTTQLPLSFPKHLKQTSWSCFMLSDQHTLSKPRHPNRRQLLSKYCALSRSDHHGPLFPWHSSISSDIFLRYLRWKTLSGV